MRAGGRRPGQLRPTRITRDVQKFAAASAMIDCGGIRELLQIQRAVLP